MSETRRWRDGPLGADGDERLVAQATELLERFEQAEEDEPWTPANGGERWRRLRGEIQRQGRRKPSFEVWALSTAAVSMAALGVVLFWPHQSASRREQAPDLARPTQVASAPAPAAPPPTPAALEPWEAWPKTDLGPNGTVWSEPGSVMRLPASPTERSSVPRNGYVVQLDRGSLCAEVASRQLGSEGPFRVKTRELEVTVLGTHFCVEAGSDLSSVSVQRGRVRVARGEVSVVLEASESIRSDSQRLKAAALPRAWRDHSAPGNPVAALEDTPEPAGSLSLENDLYQRALQETRSNRHPQAAGLLADYLKRFPAGLYAPEAGSQLANQLALAGHPTEALAAARERLRSFPSDPHDGDVKLLMANLLHESLGRPADALPVYEDLLNAPSGSDWRAEALFGKGGCEQRLGADATAKESWRRYQAEYPNGRHAAEVGRLLGE